MMTDHSKYSILADNEAIVEALKQKNEETVRLIYRDCYPGVKNWILKNSGNEVMAQDIFQDALIKLLEKATAGNLILSSPVCAYLFAISRNMWLNYLNRDKFRHSEEIDENMFEPVMFADEIEDETNKNILRKCFVQLSEKCKRILELYYYEDRSMTEIAEEFGYASDQIARNKKYNCSQRLKKLIRETNEY